MDHSVRKAAAEEPQSYGPIASLPLRFVLTGLISAVGAITLLILRPDLLATYHYNQYIIAVTHLWVLGFLLSIVMGAMYQLAPVALETELHSERLARWQFPLHVIGFVGMVWMFWRWNLEAMGHYASLLALGVGLFVYNLGRTLRQVKRWDVVALTMASALVWLSLTILAGLYLAASKCWTFSPFNPIAAMHAHAHLGGLGVFVLLIVGVSYKLMPMFVLAHVQNNRRAKASIWLLNAGLIVLFVTMLFGWAWKLAGALVVVAGLALYALEVRAILKVRIRRKLDWGMIHFLTGIAWLTPLSILGVVLCWPSLPANAWTVQLENVYGFVALCGIVGFAILGMLYKIIPFLIWNQVYSPAIGYAKVPALSDMVSTRLQALGYCTLMSGFVTTAVATACSLEGWIRIGLGVLALGLLLFAANVALILSHRIHPRLPKGLKSQPPDQTTTQTARAHAESGPQHKTAPGWSLNI